MPVHNNAAKPQFQTFLEECKSGKFLKGSENEASSLLGPAPKKPWETCGLLPLCLQEPWLWREPPAPPLGVDKNLSVRNLPPDFSELFTFALFCLKRENLEKPGQWATKCTKQGARACVHVHKYLLIDGEENY